MASSNEIGFLTERDTTKRLKNLGKKLLRNNATVDKILELLDKLELELSMVNQSPTEPIQESLVPSMKALISDELLRSTNEDIKISVTSCIAEITRITAPDAPYDDELMKEIFKLMVAAFDKLSDVSGRCYEKTLAIIDNVAKIRLCLVMLDLECDDLVIEMFQHFLRVIRSSHPQNAIDSMESIMTMVLDESEEVSPNLLKPLLDSIRKENETISPISRTLAEKVVTNCAVKLKPYLMRAVESSGRALDDYEHIVTSICQNGPESAHDDHSNESNKAVVEGVENGLDAAKDAGKQPCDVTKRPEEPDMTCVGVAEIMDNAKSNLESANESNRGDQIIKKSGSKRKLHPDLAKKSKSSNAKAKANSKTGILDSVRESESETQLNTVPKKRGHKPNSLMNAEEGYDHSWIHKGKKTGKPALSRKNGNSSSPIPPSKNCTTGKDNTQSERITVSEDLVSQPKKGGTAKPVRSRKTKEFSCDLSPYENHASVKENVNSKHKDTSEGHGTLVSDAKTNENNNVGAPSNNGNIIDTSRPKRGRPRKRISSGNEDAGPSSVSKTKKDNLNPRLEVISLESHGVRVKEEPVEMNDPEVRPHATIRKIRFTLKSNKKPTGAPEPVVAVMESNISCEHEEKPKLGINGEAENRDEGRSSSQKEVKKRSRRNATPSKDLKKSSATKEQITGSASKTLSRAKKTPQPRMRRRQTTVKVEPSETHDQTHDLDNSLVGRSIKVWWPMDKRYYEGIVDSYDPVRGKHKISYADGDVEILNLKKQRWEIITDDVSQEEEQGLALHKLAEASDIAQKSNDKTVLEPTKYADVNSKSRRGKACAKISSNSESVKCAAKSAETSALDISGLDPESTERPQPPKIIEQQESSISRKPDKGRLVQTPERKDQKLMTLKRKRHKMLEFEAPNASRI